MHTHYQGSPEEQLALNSFIKLTRGTESLMSRLANCGSLQGLTISQFGVLETLLHLGPMCQSELGGKLLRSGGNITLVIDNLEKQGLVVRQRDTEDRRMVIVSLTPAGEAMIQQVFPAHLAAIMAQMHVLTAAEQQMLGDLCRKLGKQEREP